VGITSGVAARVCEIQFQVSHDCRPVRLAHAVGMCPTIAGRVERAVHRRLCYAALGGEWFAENPRVCLRAVEIEADYFTAKRDNRGGGKGRKALNFTAEQLREAKSIWRNVKEYPTWEAALAAMPEGFTTARAFKLWKGRH
jgi:hypothetical protein